jgi:23S rRNA pseudouridine2604 synthase
MSFSKTLSYFLVHELKTSYREVNSWIENGEVEVDGIIVRNNCTLSETAGIKVKGISVREQKKFHHFLFHKPRGIESTLNPKIPSTLCDFIPEGLKLHPAGRLDKFSEGLMILTDDGAFTWNILHTGLEKEYWVEVDKSIDSTFKEKMENGIEILGQLTKPCKVNLEKENAFSIILNQGLNRQIRRMCYKCGVEVQVLKRVRIDKYDLGAMGAGQLIRFYPYNSATKT